MSLSEFLSLSLRSYSIVGSNVPKAPLRTLADIFLTLSSSKEGVAETRYTVAPEAYSLAL